MPPLTFVSAVKLFFHDFFNFTGRLSTRREFWFVTLFILLTSLLLALVGAGIATMGGIDPSNIGAMIYIGTPLLAFYTFLLIPMIALEWRRYRDAGFPGWLALLSRAVALTISGNEVAKILNSGQPSMQYIVASLLSLAFFIILGFAPSKTNGNPYRR